MLDIDYPPAVFAIVIAFVFVLPALYGMIFVDSYWEKNKAEDTGKDDAFN